MQNKNLVEIRVVNPKKAGVFTFGPYWDEEKRTSRELKYSNGNPRSYKLTGNTQPKLVLDISNPDDKLLYEHIKDHPTFANRENPLIKIKRITEEAEEKFTKQEAALEAQIVIRDLNGVELASFSRLFGISPVSMSEKSLKNALYEYAAENPQKVMEEARSPNRELKELLLKGKATGFFAVDKQGTWKYNNTTMGIGLEGALVWAKQEENEELIPFFRKELKGK